MIQSNYAEQSRIFEIGQQVNEVIQSKYAEKSGVIKIGQQLNKDVKIENLIAVDKPELGKGGFGEVTKRLFKNNILAVKTIKNRFYRDDKEKTCMELEVLLRTIDKKFPNTITYYGFIYSRYEIHIVMEIIAMDFTKLYEAYLIPQGKAFPEQVLGKFAVNVVAALRHLFKCSIIHRDIKPANIFIDWDGTIKLGDFGIAEMLSEPSSPYTYSSPPPFGPCIQYNCPKITDYSADIWSFGLTLFELAICKYPYEKGKTSFECAVILCNPSSEKLPDIYSQDFHEFVKSCMDIEKRPSYIDLVNSSWHQRHRTNDVNLCFWLSHVLEHSTTTK